MLGRVPAAWLLLTHRALRLPGLQCLFKRRSHAQDPGGWPLIDLCVRVYLCVCVRMCVRVALYEEQNRDTVVNWSEVAALFHIDTDLRPICRCIALAHLRTEERQDGIWKWT